MKALTLLSKFKKKFDRELTRFLTRKINQAKKIDPKVAFLVKQIKDMASAGGKRLRPAFCYFGYRACGGEDKKEILKLSLAIELTHAALLIHDDIIDDSDLRRGKPTIYKASGLPVALLVGDIASSLADEIFNAASFPSDRLKEARKYFDLLAFEVVGGEYLDVLGGKTEEEILKILEYKTARYSVVRPLQIGAALAGAPAEVFTVFEKYGIPAGIAFQIKDDILGMFDKEEVIGKPADSDLKEGKKTLLVVKALEASKGKEKKKFLELLGNPNCTLKDLEWVRGIIKKTGSLEYAEKLAKGVIEKAKAVVKDGPLQAEEKDFLIGMADYIIEREY